jgi:hypothetical protein
MDVALEKRTYGDFLDAGPSPQRPFPEIAGNEGFKVSEVSMFQGL